MKELVFIILDRFTDWETAFLSTAINSKSITENYSVSYASIDKKIITSCGNLKILPDITIDEISGNVEGLILIGADKSWRNLDNKAGKKIISLVKMFKNNNKIVGAICDAAYFLATNGLLNNCRHTTNSLEEIKNSGNYTNSRNFENKRSITDRKIITAKGDSPIHFSVDVIRTLGNVSEKKINFFYDMFIFGYDKAMENFNKNDNSIHKITDIIEQPPKR